MGKVTVVLEKLKNLKDTDGAMNHPDPYVKMELEKDNFGPFDKKYGEFYRTKCRSSTKNFNKFSNLRNI